jgi:enoyl-CoA hydratase/carnithine racemase
MLALFARMLRLPVVTVAAVNGHAFAAGAMMALTHDFRVMRRDRGYWCLPEADLGMPLAPGMNDLIAARLAPQVAHEAIVTGRRYPADEAAAAAIVDDTADEDQVVERAVARAATHAGQDRGAVTALRVRLYADLIATLEEGALP